LTILDNSGLNLSLGALGQLNRALKKGLKKKFLGKITAMVIDPRLFILEPRIGIFTTLL
jgi:hypothetical protein